MEGIQKRKNSLGGVLKDNILIVILIVTVVIGILLSDTFPKPENIKNILFSCCVYGILAIGQTVVMLTKEIDLSIGSLVAFCPIFAIELVDAIQDAATGSGIIKGGNYVMEGWPAIVILTLLAGALVGLATGTIVVKLKVPSLIVTLGMMTALHGLVYVLSGGYAMYLTKLEGANLLGTKTVAGVIPVSFLLFLAIGIVMALLLKYTKFGMRIYSTGGNERAAQISGINTGKWKQIAFVLSGLFAAVAAIIYCSRMEAVDAMQGTGYEMTAIAVAVIGGVTLEGGKGKVVGTILATVILTMILNIQQLLGLVAWYQNMTIGIIIVLAALLHNYQGKRHAGAVQVKAG